MFKQGNPVVPPQPTDGKLRDFAQIINNNLLTLFQVAHAHRIVTAVPTDRDGEVGDIYLIDITGAKKIAVKFNDGWYAVALTAI